MVLIDPAREADFVARRGDVLMWRCAYKCSCSLNPGVEPTDANRANVNCTVCDGLGFTYGTAVPIVATITQIMYQKQLLDSGVASPGDLLMSVSPYDTHNISSYDVINFTYAAGEPYEGDTLNRLPDPGPDMLSFPAVVVIRCFWIDQSNNDAVQTFQPGVDFLVNNRELTWLPGRGPPVGEGYTIKYNARFDWEVFIDPSVRFEVGHSLGQRAMLRKRELPVPLLFKTVAERVTERAAVRPAKSVGDANEKPVSDRAVTRV